MTKGSCLFTRVGRFSISGVALLALCFTSVAAQKTTTSYHENVTTTIFDTDSTGAQVLFRSDDANGVGQATYVTGGKGTNTVNSLIESNGEWQLDFGGASPRGFWVTPDDAIDGSQPAGPPPGLYLHPAKVYSTCRDQSGNIVPFENLVNGSGSCSLGVDFVYNGTEYKLLMNPSGVPPDTGAVCPSTGCPATGVSNVACNAVSNNRCVSWTITPNMAAPNATVASLFSYTSSRTATAPWVYIGQCYNTFRINVMYP